MGFLRVIGRFLAAFVGFVIVLYPGFVTVGIFTPPDPFFQMSVFAPLPILAAVGALLLIWQDRSVRRLGRFSVAVLCLMVVLGTGVLSIMAWVTMAVTGILTGGVDGMTIQSFANLLYLIITPTIYLLAYSAVYRDGYADLKARFTS